MSDVPLLRKKGRIETCAREFRRVEQKLKIFEHLTGTTAIDVIEKLAESGLPFLNFYADATEENIEKVESSVELAKRFVIAHILQATVDTIESIQKRLGSYFLFAGNYITDLKISQHDWEQIISLVNKIRKTPETEDNSYVCVVLEPVEMSELERYMDLCVDILYCLKRKKGSILRDSRKEKRDYIINALFPVVLLILGFILTYFIF